jgi:hypothetical protein
MSHRWDPWGHKIPNSVTHNLNGQYNLHISFSAKESVDEFICHDGNCSNKPEGILNLGLVHTREKIEKLFRNTLLFKENRYLKKENTCFF